MSETILFFGNERLATGVKTTAPVLQSLIEAGYKLAAVVVSQNDTTTSRTPRPLEVVSLAESHNIPVLSPADLGASLDQLAGFGAQAAVLIAYGKLVPQTIIDLFPRGIINLHPSLLPLHRGPTPLESVLLAGETRTGVSLMRLTQSLDAGPVYAQQSFAMPPNSTKQFLADELGKLGAATLTYHLGSILAGNLTPKPQDEHRASYDDLIKKTDGKIDFNLPAELIERQIRAYAGWPRSRTQLGSTEVIITQARVSHDQPQGVPGHIIIDGQQLAIACGQNQLIVDKLIPTGKSEMNTGAFLSGYNL